LPWDQIKTTEYKASQSLEDAVSILRANHLQRTDDDADFNYLVAGIEELNEQRATKSVSLSLAVREAEREESQARQLELANQRRVALGLEPVADLEEVGDDEVPDVVLDVAAAIVADMNDLPQESLARVSH
jgi:carboxyl-terminal processing protease